MVEAGSATSETLAAIESPMGAGTARGQVRDRIVLGVITEHS